LKEEKSLVNEMLEAVDSLGKIKTGLIVLHNNPDPDSIGAALGLKEIFLKLKNINCTISYGGIISRAENLAMIHQLRVKLTHISKLNQYRFPLVILVDTQPGAGNNSLSKDITPHIVIDTHIPLRKKTRKAIFYDVRKDIASTSAVVTQYIKELSLPIGKFLATALYYGIKTDIWDIGREITVNDQKSLIFLTPYISLVTLRKIEKPRLKLDHLIMLTEGIKKVEIVRDVIICDTGEIKEIEFIAEISDLLQRIEKIKWVFALGEYQGEIFFSIRTTTKKFQAGKIALKLAKGKGTAGGHFRSAAGKIQTDKGGVERLKEHFLKLIGREGIKRVKLFDMFYGNTN